jgi:hypothetical protein
MNIPSLRPSLAFPLLAVAAVATASCAATQGSGFSNTGSSGTGGGGNSGTGGGDTGITGIGGSGNTSSGSSGMSSAYAHTNNTLFKLDPSQPSLALTQIGTFSCIGNGSGMDSSMTDLAVNETGDVWAVSAHNVYKLTLPTGAGSVQCATTYSLSSASSSTFYGLTFAPVGIIDPAKEVLVAGNTAGELWAIDVTTNPPTLTQHGTLGNVPANDGQGHNYGGCTNKNGDYCGTVGSAWELSGDVVFLANNGNPVGFATVRDCQSPPSSSSCNPTDTLVELDMSAIRTPGTQSVVKSVRGQIVKATGCNDNANADYGSMYGIAAYGNKVLGFSHQGFIVTIDNTTGAACLALSTSSDSWAGAAITTVAQIVPPTQ